MASGNSEINKPQRGHSKRATSCGTYSVRINTGVQSIDTESLFKNWTRGQGKQKIHLPTGQVYLHIFWPACTYVLYI